MNDTERARRRFLKEGAALASLAAMGGIRSGYGQMGESEGAATHPTDPKSSEAYGERSRFVKSVRLGSQDEPFGLTRHALTPLQDSMGIITPSSLHYVMSHRPLFVPDIDPQQHRLMIHGMVDRPLIFTMEELKRFPFVSRIHYLECNANKATPRHKTLQEAAGRTSCSEWTGVPLSLLLKEAGVQNGALWVVAEGTESTKGAMSIPLAKAMEDTLLAYGQNGEPVRPQNGFPLRLVPPGFEGQNAIKWLRRIEVVDKFQMTFNELQRYTGGGPEIGLAKDWVGPKTVELNFEQGPKSVITSPSGGQRLPSRGHIEISGLAWSGGGAIRKVEVSTDGGRSWKDAEIRGPVHRIAHTRFGMSWNWNGEESVLMSRCTDELGQVQPTLAEFARFYKQTMEYLFSNLRVGHDNFILPWKVGRDGSVQNGLA